MFSPQEDPKNCPRWTVTLLIGVAMIVFASVLLVIDVVQRGGAIYPYEPLTQPRTFIERLARWGAINMTPLCWTGYLLVLDGLLTIIGCRPPKVRIAAHGSAVAHPGSPVRRAPGRFILCYLSSIGVWLFFDWVNFYYMHAWEYHGLPENIRQRYTGYFLAFGAITPGLLLTAELFRQLGFGAVNWRSWRIGRRGQIFMVVLGMAFIAFPLLVRDPIGNFTLWLSLILLLDPVNHWLGGSSLIGDWRVGRYQRTVVLLISGLTCGLLWEFWNYWAVAKWTYDLPFLGPLEQIRAFEMPFLGFGGFLPFALECWVAFQTVMILAGRINPRWRRMRTPDEAVI